MDDAGHAPARPGERGEVVIQGPNVIRGYENNPEANATSFVDGWFRTGDQGFLDAERLPDAGRPPQGADQPRRREDLAARDRRGAARRIRRSPKRSASACRIRRGAKRSAAAVVLRERGQRERGPAGVLQGAAGRLQAAEADSHHRDDSAHGHRQDPARASWRRRSSQGRLVKIVIAGAGAIGGYIGAQLARAGADVVLFARGPHLRAMQERGLRVISPDGDFEVRPRVTGDLAAIGPADVVFLGVKAHGLTALAPHACARSSGPDTVVVSTQNGDPVVVFPGPRRRARRAAARARRSGRRDRRGDRAAARRRIARLFRDRHRRARRHPSHRRQPHQLRRAGRHAIGARAEDRRGADRRRLPLPGHARASATRSGSSCSATSRSIRSAR